MASNVHVAFKATDRSYFAILKKEIHALVNDAGLSKKKLAETDLIVAEMATNIVKHGRGGHLLVKPIEDKENNGIEIISIDNGPGIQDFHKMLLDGSSSKNTLGLGLGSIKRLSDFFQVYTLKDWGTIVISRVFNDKLSNFTKPEKISIRSVVSAKPGETACGDGFFSSVTRERIKVFLGDGLGHGIEAEAVIQMAGKFFMECDDADPCNILRYVNQSVRKSRGLVGCVAVLDIPTKIWKICGVGNINARIIGPSFSKNYLGYNGIIGLNVPKTLNSQQIQTEKGQNLILSSDGIKTRWDLLKLTAINRYDPSILCAAIYKDFGRNTDDTSVVAIKINY